MLAGGSRLERDVLLAHEEGEEDGDAPRASGEAMHQHAAAAGQRLLHEGEAGVEVRAQLRLGAVVNLARKGKARTIREISATAPQALRAACEA